MFDVMLLCISVLSLGRSVSKSLSGHLSDTECYDTVQTHRQKLSLVTRTMDVGDKVTNRQHSVTVPRREN